MILDLLTRLSHNIFGLIIVECGLWKILLYKHSLRNLDKSTVEQLHSKFLLYVIENKQLIFKAWIKCKWILQTLFATENNG